MSEVDYYDVQSMIRDARSEIRGEIADAVAAARQELRAEIDELTQHVRGIERTMQARTEHLV